MLTTRPHFRTLQPQTGEVVERAEAVMRDVRELQGTPVFCRFDKGTLSLHGRVHSFHAKQLAQTAAAGIPGITRIQNQLEVVPRGQVPTSGSSSSHAPPASASTTRIPRT